MNKEKSRQIFMGVVLVGLIVCLIVYFLVFNKYNDLTSELKSKNATLQTQVDDMKVYYDEMETNRVKKEEYFADIQAMLEDYPANAKEEDAIMMAVRTQENAIVNYNKINFDFPEVIHTVDEEIVKGIGSDEMTSAVNFSERLVSYENNTDYGNLKNCVATIYNSPYRVGIKNISYKKKDDTSRVIEGTIDIVYYSVDGIGKEYTAPDMPSYLPGTSDLFNILYTVDDNGVTIWQSR